MTKKHRGDKLTTFEPVEVVGGTTPDGTVRALPIDTNGVVPVSFTGASPDFPSVVTIRDKTNAANQVSIDGDGNLQVEVNNLPAGMSTEATLVQVRDHLDTVETKLQTVADNTDTLETKLQTLIDAQDTVETKLQSLIDSDSLTARMKAFNPQAGYRIWVETGLATYIYIAENTAGAATTDSTFAGIRIPLVNGNPSGEVEVSTDMTWSTKAGTWT